MPSKFNAIIIEGRFLLEEPLRCDTASGLVDVREALRPFIGTCVKLAAHHLPSDPSRWGFGCCMWQTHGTCPAGHHVDPQILYNVVVEGNFAEVAGSWVVTGFDGTETVLDLSRMLRGHEGRILVANCLTMEAMQEVVNMSHVEGQVEALGAQADTILARLSRLSRCGRSDD